MGAAAGSMSVPWLVGQKFESAGPASLLVMLLADLAAALVTLAVLLACSVRIGSR